MSFNKETNMYEGFIYKIYNDVNNKIYIGQTTVSIKERWHGHMSSALSPNYNTALYNAMRKYGREKFHIEEIDKICEKTKDDLLKKLNNLEQLRIKEYHSLVSENGYNIEKGGLNKFSHGRRVNQYDKNLNLLNSYPSIADASNHVGIDSTTIWAVCNNYYYLAGGFVWSYAEKSPRKPDYDKILHPLNYRESRKQPYKSKAMSNEEKKLKKLLKLHWNGERICQYNAFGEIVKIFDDPIQASEELNTTPSTILKNVNGENLCFHKTVLRYECDPFDKYKMSKQLKPLSLYTIEGKLIKHFECQKDLEQFLRVPRGEISKVLKRGGSIKGYLVSEYGKPIIRNVYRCNKQILMLNDKKEIIKEFNSQRDVYKYFNIHDDYKSFNKSLEQNILYKGYYWKIKEEYKIA